MGAAVVVSLSLSLLSLVAALSFELKSTHAHDRVPYSTAKGIFYHNAAESLIVVCNITYHRPGRIILHITPTPPFVIVTSYTLLALSLSLTLSRYLALSLSSSPPQISHPLSKISRSATIFKRTITIGIAAGGSGGRSISLSLSSLSLSLRPAPSLRSASAATVYFIIS